MWHAIRLVVLALGLGTLSAPAQAGKKDDAWAKCLWENAPQSAANWLAMTEPKDRYSINGMSAYELLEFRLRAACHVQLTPAGKRFPPGLNRKAVRASLIATRPTEIAADKVEPDAYQCTRYFLNDTEMKTPAAFHWGFGDFDSGVSFSSMSFQFAAAGGGGVGLPETGGLRKCLIIQADGSLIEPVSQKEPV